MKKPRVDRGERYAAEVPVPPPSRELYVLRLPARSEIEIYAAPDEEMCVRKERGCVVVWTRKRAKKGRG